MVAFLLTLALGAFALSVVDKVAERPAQVQRLVEKLLVDVQGNVIDKPATLQRLVENPVIDIVDKAVDIPVQRIVECVADRWQPAEP